MILSQISRWSRNIRQLISIKRFHNLTQPLMTLILMIPLILMILHLPLLIQRQSHKAVDRLAIMHYPRRVLLSQFKGNLRWGDGDDFGGKRFGGNHYFGYTLETQGISHEDSERV